MVAVVSGSGLGLFGTTGGLGSPNAGRGGERVFVNSATGNLVIQGVDETLIARGLDLALVRTYNSQGLLNDDNGDNWRLGVQRRVYALSGTINTADSTITKVFGDGAEVVYSYDETLGAYVSTEGDGAHDTLKFSVADSEWTWTDESSRATETYDADGRLIESSDADANVVSYIYSGQHLTEIVDASGQHTFLDYTGDNLSQIRVVSDGATQTLTRYAYDPQNRLSTVTVDLSPDDNAIADGDVYVTTYTYENTSHRVASVTQTDGSSCAFTYQLIDGEYRVHTYTDGEGRVTTLEYTQSSGAGGSQPTTVPANAGTLTTTDSQTVTTDYPRNDAAVSTTETTTTTVTHPVISGALSTSDTQTTNVSYLLNAGALTTPAMGWLGPDTRATPASVANDARIGFDSQGNGISVWRAEHNVFAQRFDAATGTWGALSILDSLTTTVSGVQLSVDGAGNALAAWIQSDGTAASLYASRYDATAGTWSAALPVESAALAVSTAAGSIVTAINGANAVVSWLQTDGTRNNLYAARLSGSAWSAPQLLEASDNVANQPSIAMDGAGNIAVLWQQSNGTANSVYSTRYSASTNSWSVAALLETSSTAINDPLVAFDAAGNGLAIWREAGNLFARRYTASTDTWAAQVALDNRTNTVSSPELAVDRATGNAVAVWVQSDGVANSLYSSRFTASTGTWSTAQLLETGSLAVATTAGSVSASISGANVAVSWLQTDGTRNNLYVARFAAGAWTAPQLVEANDNAAAQGAVAVDGSGNVSVFWQQIADEATNLFVNRFTAATSTWSGAVLRPSPATTVNDPRIAFDSAGNAVAIWRAYSNIYAQRFSRATGTWGPLAVIDSRTNTTSAPSLSVDDAGNAVAAWVQSDGTANSVYTSYLNASTGVWTSPAALLEDSPLVVPTAAGSVVTAINNGHAAVAWLQTDGVNNLYVARYVAGAWTVGDSVEASDAFAAAQPSLSVDAGGNVVVSWQQAATGVTNSVWVNRFAVGTGAWSGPALAEVNNVAINNPRFLLDNAGNGLGVWREGGNVYAVRYDLATNAWQPQVLIDTRTNTIGLVDLAMDRATGNALAVWVQSDGVANSVYAARYTASTHAWAAPVLIESSSLAVATTAGTLVASMSGGNAAVAWLQTDGTRNNLMVARFSAGAWSAAQVVESRDTVPAQPSIAVDSNGFVSVMWQQSDGTNLGINVNRFGSGGGAPYYTVQLGDTWASIATALYGNAAAASALQTALGNPALNSGIQLAGFPPSLNVSTTTTITVPPYYLIQSGDTWASIATLLYGTAEVADQLQTALGNPALTPGNHLTGLPGNRSTTTTTTVTVPPYYIVRATDTSFASVATLLYGNAAASGQLQSHNGNPAFAVGLRLNTLPATISVTTTSTVTVPAYYLVQADDEWADIALAVYGTDDANAVQALSDAFPGVTLADGMHLVVPTSLTYTPVNAGNQTLFLTTEIEDPLGLITTLQHNSAGRLTRAQGPTVGGVRPDTRYFYDADGNLTSTVEDPAGTNRVTTFGYDDRGNLTLSRDNTGNTVTRTYDTNNQVLTESRYRIADPDGAGNALPLGAMTAHYIYDAESHLRFAISAEGRVVERRYADNGQIESTFTYVGDTYSETGFGLEDLEDWVEDQDLTKLQRADYAYDFRGNVQSVKTWAKTDADGEGIAIDEGGFHTVSITQFVYDQRGRLLQTIEARGVEETPDAANASVPYSTTFTYDGLGRELSRTQWISQTVDAQDNVHAVVRTTLTDYLDASRQTEITMANGLVATSVYNTAGELISVIQGDSGQFGTTSYTYDDDGRLRMTTDPTLVRHFYFYDDAGRKIAEVDGNGTLTEFVYNRTSQLIKAVQYSENLDPSSLVDGSSAPVDRTIGQLRAAAGGDSDQNRISRNVYDRAGRLIYTVDADGAVAHSVYDGAGRVIEEVHYSEPVTIGRLVDEVTPSQLASGGVYAIDPSEDHDRSVRHFYDGDGNRIGTLDAEGYLVEFEYNPAGQLVHQIGYATVVPEEDRDALTLGDLRPPLEEDPYTWIADTHVRFYYDGQGKQIGGLDAQGFVTVYLYDVTGHVTMTTRYGRAVEYTPEFSDLVTDASGEWVYGYGYYGYDLVWQPSETQNQQARYNGAGEVVSETSHEQIETTYEYTPAGQVYQKIEAAQFDDRPTTYRYDGMGRVIQELSGEGGTLLTPGLTAQEVDSIWDRYGVRYAYDLAGRRVSATVRPDDEQTNTTWFFYDNDGQLRFEVNARGERREYRYNTFGQLEHEIAYYDRLTTYADFPAANLATLGGGLLDPASTELLTRGESENHFARTTYTYTSTGLVASRVTKAGASATYSYNAFGEVSGSIQAVDASRSLAHTYEYDRRGLLSETRWDPNRLNTTESRAYDAFGRLTDVTDARGNTSKLEYDKLGRQTAAIDARGARTLTMFDAFSRVTAVLPSTLSGADMSGGLSYVNAVRYLEIHSGSGRAITTTYLNAFGDVSTQSVGQTGNYQGRQYDRNGNLRSVGDSYGTLEYNIYDRRNRRTSTTDANGTISTFRYDEANRLVRQMADSAAGHLQLETVYEYDALGRLTTLTEPNGRVTRTDYDDDGRVTAITVNPSSAGTDRLRTEFEYDLAGNVVLKIEDADGAPRRTKYEYDVFGRMTRTIVDATDPANPGEYLDLETQYFHDDNGNVTREIDPEGHSTWFVYDANNRVVQTVDALGGVTEMTYGFADHVVARRRYAAAVDTALLGNEISAPLDLAESLLDRVTRSFYDAEGRERYTVDGLGGVTERGYDVSGNVVLEHRHQSPVSITDLTTTADLDQILGYSLGSEDHVHWTSYDSRGRLAFTADFGGAFTEYRYDNAGNVVATVLFADQVNSFLSGEWFDMFAHASGIANPSADRVTRFWYDAVGRVRFSLDAEGYLRETRYDTAGRSETSIVYAQNALGASADFASASLEEMEAIVDGIDDSAKDRSTTTSYDLAGRITRVDFTDGTFEVFTYDDVGNRLTYRNQTGAIWHYEYDDVGRLIEERSPSVSTTVVSVNASNQEWTSEVDDAVIITRRTYDNLGNLESLTEGIELIDGVERTAGSRVTTYQYDVLGRMTRMIVDPTGLDLETQYCYDINGNLTREINPEGHSTWFVYDVNNRVVQTIDALGGVTGTTYNFAGQVVARRRYEHAISTALLGNEISAPVTLVSSSLDRVTRSFYDSAGRERYTVDGMGGVVERRYDASGNVVFERQYESPALVTDFTTAAVLQQSLSYYFGATDHVRWMAYDRLGRLAFTAELGGAFTEYHYDNAGNVVTKVAYAAQAEFPVAGDTLDMVAYTSELANPDADQVTRFWYDALGRVRFSLDAEGYLRETRYDPAGRSETSIVYAQNALGALPEFADADLAAVEGIVDDIDNLAKDQTTTIIRDAAGRVTRTNFADGTYEAFSYDGIGNRLTYRNQAGAVWHYAHDANGRLLEERSPSVSTTVVSVDAANEQQWTSEVEDAVIVTRMTYDNLGNVSTLTEGIRRINGVEHTAGSRVTRYDYDLLGRQTVTHHPSVRVYNGAAADAANTDPLTMLQETEVSDPVSTVTYNTLGDAVVNVDVSGAVTRKVYDNIGRVKFEIDALGYLTQYDYDVFGNRRFITRIATPVPGASDSVAEWTQAYLDNEVSTGSTDRTIEIVYDNLNRQVLVRQPWTFVYTTALDDVGQQSLSGAGETQFEYNAFGQLTLKRTLLHPSGFGYEDTRYFYDRNGRQRYELNPLNFVTRTDYDALGNVVRQIEFARPIAGIPSLNELANTSSTTHLTQPDNSTGYDHDTEFFYDVMGRVAEQRVHEVEYMDFAVSDVDPQYGTQVTKFGYDAVGNRTMVAAFGVAGSTAAADAITTNTYYDALGRIVGMAEPERLADQDVDYAAEDFVPFVEMRRDVYGNLVQEIRYQQGAVYNATTGKFEAPGAPDEQLDHSSLMLLDVYGRAKRTRDAAGAVRFASYTIRGDVAKEWQNIANADGGTDTLVTIRKYDLLGREVETIEPMRKSDSTVTTVSASVGESMRYYQVAGGAPLEWVGTNRVHVSWPELAGIRVRVTIEYTQLTQAGAAGAQVERSQEFVATRGGETLTWQDAAGLSNAGVHSVQRVIVEEVGPGGSLTLRYDSDLPPPEMTQFYRQTIYTRVRYNAFGEITGKDVNASAEGPGANYDEYFEYDNAGHVRRTNSGDGVDRMYLYDVAGRTTAEIRSQTVGLIASLDPQQALSFEDVMLTETVYNRLDQVVLQRTPVYLLAGEPGPVSNTVTALRVDHERLEQMDNPSLPGQSLYRWQGENVVDLSWEDLGNVPVLIRYGYTSLPGSEYGYNSPQAVQFVRAVVDGDGGTGYIDQFITENRLQDWVIEQGIAGSPAGISTIDWVEVYGQDASGDYTVLLRGDNVPVIVREPALPIMAQRLDRWGNVVDYTDTAGNTTQYRYGVLGSLLETKLPQVAVLDTRDIDGNDRFADSPGTPTQRNYFDILGRAIGTRDANGNLDRVVLDDIGQVTQEIHADGGERSFVYDTFGNQVQVTVKRTSDTDWITQTSYDRDNRAILVRTEYARSPTGVSVFLTREFGYDEAGRRITETTGALMDNLVTKETTKYFYDLLGKLIERRTPMGHRNVLDYDVRGNKVFEENGDGDQMTWQFDAFGHVQLHADMGGNVTTYTYANGAGLLTSQSSSIGQQIAYEYDEAGHLVRINDTGVNRDTVYEYDDAGRRSRETTTVDGLTHQDVEIEYDELNRISHLTDLRYSVTYHYDAKGNRTRINATYRDNANVEASQDLWYTYDKMNRVVLSQGSHVGNSLDISAEHGLLLSYYLDGQRESVTQFGFGKLEIVHDENTTDGSQTLNLGTTYGRYTEGYEYDGAGRLVSISRTGTEVNSFDGVRFEGSRQEFGLEVASTREYDVASRETADNWVWNEQQTTRSTYDDDGRIRVQTTHGSSAANALRKTQTDFTYSNADVLLSYQVQGFKADGQTEDYTSHYYNYYTLGDSYLQADQNVQTIVVGETTMSGLIQRTYNKNRELVSVVDTEDHTHNRYFANDANGQAMTVVQGDLTSAGAVSGAMNSALSGIDLAYARAQHFFFAKGENVGTLGRLQQGSELQTRASFDVNYTPLEQLAATAPLQVVVQQGDTLRSIAARIYGDEGLWYLIAEENGEVSPDADLAVGRLLRIPSQVTSLSNSANSFKPFNVEQVIGDVTATQVAPPPPAAQNGCGIVGTLIVAVVAIVAAMWLGPIVGQALGNVFASLEVGAAATAQVTLATAFSYSLGYGIGVGAAAGLGSIVGQGIAVAVHAQEEFSWKAVAATALTAGLMGGLGVGELFDANPSFAQMMIKGAVGSAINQGVNVALGLQEKFDWNELALSSVSSAVAGEITEDLDGDVSRAVVGTFTSTAVRSLMGGRVEADAVLADIFANVIGNSIVDHISTATADAASAAAIKAEVDAQLAAEWKRSVDETIAQVTGGGIGGAEGLQYVDSLYTNPIVGDILSGSDASVEIGGDVSIDWANADDPFDVPYPRTLVAATTEMAAPLEPLMDWQKVLRKGVKFGFPAAVWSAADALNKMSGLFAQKRVEDIIDRYGLDSSRDADVLAARAYVWMENNVLTVMGGDVQWSGPTNVAAGEAVMRLELVNPGLLGSAYYGNQDAQKMISMAAHYAAMDITFGLAGAKGEAPASIDSTLEGSDFTVLESRARPANAPDELQTTYQRALAALRYRLPPGKFEMHHLIPAQAWGLNLDLAKSAYSAGWRPDSYINLMALPGDEETQRLFFNLMPIHNGYHKDYNMWTISEIAATRSALGGRAPTPLEARGILDTIALSNRAQIRAGVWHPQVH